jgi:hypothetical protein
MTATKPRLNTAAQERLMLWIKDGLGPRNRADFVAHFAIKDFSQTTFNRNIGPSGSFTEEQARVICRALARSFDELRGPTPTGVPQATDATCTHRCDLFHAINKSTCPSPNEAEVRLRATWKVDGHYEVTYRFVRGTNETYEVKFAKCSRCGASLFDYVRDHDPVPQCSFGVALLVGEMLSIYMIGEGYHWTLACSVPRQLDRQPLTGIILDPNPKTSQIEANKFVLVKLGTPVAKSMTKAKIDKLLGNKPGVPDGTLVSVRE